MTPDPLPPHIGSNGPLGLLLILKMKLDSAYTFVQEVENMAPASHIARFGSKQWLATAIRLRLRHSS
ncbi:MAG: hypothetical protein OXN89_16125 [Bryobacterales bacterium]|nr:hypothetical protein [Bryobacterales bacterium]